MSIQIVLDYVPGDILILDYVGTSQGTALLTSSAYILLPLSLLSSSAYILPYTEADPYHFVYENDDSGIAYPSDINRNSYDLKLKHVCDHVLSTGTYKLTTCPRCAGNGYYYDAKLDSQGLPFIIYGVDKVAQELEKIVISERNPFHREYGANLAKYLNTVIVSNDLSSTSAVIKQDILHAIQQLQLLQQQESAYITIAQDEFIDSVDSIEILEPSTDPTALVFRVTLIMKSGRENTIIKSIVL